MNRIDFGRRNETQIAGGQTKAWKESKDTGAGHQTEERLISMHAGQNKPIYPAASTPPCYPEGLRSENFPLEPGWRDFRRNTFTRTPPPNAPATAAPVSFGAL